MGKKKIYARIAAIRSLALCGKVVESVEVHSTEPFSFTVHNEGGTSSSFDLSVHADMSLFQLLLERLGIPDPEDTGELVGLRYDGDGLTGDQRAERDAEKARQDEKTKSGLHFIFGYGGSMGARYTVKLDGKEIGFFYADAGDGVDVEEVIEKITSKYNHGRNA